MAAPAFKARHRGQVQLNRLLRPTARGALGVGERCRSDPGLFQATVAAAPAAALNDTCAVAGKDCGAQRLEEVALPVIFRRAGSNASMAPAVKPEGQGHRPDWLEEWVRIRRRDGLCLGPLARLLG